MSKNAGTDDVIERICQLVREGKADDLSNDALLDACIGRVQKDDAAAEDAGVERRPRGGAARGGALGAARPHRGTRRRWGTRAPAAARRRPHARSGTLKSLIHDMEVGIETAQEAEGGAG